ncbi:glycosyltransferase family 4 protein [Thermofilum pendens]|uniref:Glycosyl transferase, group 1 n=1 Tax=Thermofilum pendens (strain DSM 2475 / Hrk 5) TaxID=368408 RepID=A1S0Y8_THEPD|nr:glycosyltransferase family 4 protein [Thermofilum pendens]ABL79118.1 glycosyl transferase, group 1 [Thermofilum pendens Hrk 5]
MKILYVNPANIDYPGGGERFAVEVLTRLSKRGHEVGVLHINWAPHPATSAGNESKLLDRGAELHKCGYIKLPRGFPVVDPRCLVKPSKQYDVLYIPAYSPNELTVSLLKKSKALSVPAVAVFHCMLADNVLARLYTPLYIAAFNSFDKLHVLNRFQRNFLKSHGIPEEKIEFIPNGVDTSTFQLCRDPSASEDFNIVFVGRLLKDKGVDTLLRIIYLINDELNLHDVKFTIVGSGPLEEDIKKLAQKYQNVVFLGYVKHENMPSIYREANLFLLPSRSEGMPLSLLEAQACGLPAVASKIPGVLDIVRDGVTGRLVDAEDVRGFVSAIEECYRLWESSPQEYYNLNKKIREYIVRNYDLEVVVGKIEKMLHEAIYKVQVS